MPKVIRLKPEPKAEKLYYESPVNRGMRLAPPSVIHFDVPERKSKVKQQKKKKSWKARRRATKKRNQRLIALGSTKYKDEIELAFEHAINK